MSQTRRRVVALLASSALLVVPAMTATTPASADTNPTMTLGNATVIEGNSGPVTATFPLTLSASSPNTVTVAWSTSNGNATAPADYAAQSGTVTFAPGETAKSIQVAVAGDTLDEAESEYFSVNLSTPTNAQLPYNRSSGIGTIVDDDGNPLVSASSPVVIEGSGTTVNAVFSVDLGAASPSTVSVVYATADGSAVAGKDYTAKSGTLTFTPGQRTKSVSVPVSGDRLAEAHDEYFSLNLSSCSGCLVTSGSEGIGTIVDDDSDPVVAVRDVAVLEGPTGTTTSATFTVTLSKPAVQTSTVRFATAGLDATSGTDFTAVNGTLTFLAGESTKSVVVAVKGDGTLEADEQVAFVLTTPKNLKFVQDRGFLVIRNDDSPASTARFLSLDAPVITEGNSGSPTATFQLRLDRAATTPVTVDYDTGGSGSPTTYADVSGSVTIAVGALTGSIAVPVVADTLDEPDLSLPLSINVTGAVALRTFAYGTVVDDDNDPGARVTDAYVVEGNGVGTKATVKVQLTSASPNTVSLAYATDSTVSDDYTPVSGVLTFLPGDVSKTVDIPIVGDTLDEGDGESFRVNLTAPDGVPANAMLVDQGLVYIQDDDTNPVVSIDAPTVLEGDSGTTNAVFTLSLTTPSPNDTTLGYYATPGQGATADTDFVVTDGSVVIPAGAVNATIAVPIVGDTLHEDTEWVALVLNTSTNANVPITSTSATILDNDAIPVLSVTAPTVVEGTSPATTNAVFTLSLSGPTANTARVHWTTTPYTADSPSDFTTLSGTATFNPGVTQTTVSVPIAPDAVDENSELFFLSVDSPENLLLDPYYVYWFGNSTGPAQILDDDTDPVLSIDDPAVLEGTGSNKTMTFTLALSKARSVSTPIRYQTEQVSAADTVDFTPKAPNSLVTIPAGALSATVNVTVIGDSEAEGNEIFYLRAYGVVDDANSAIPGVRIASDQVAAGLIVDNDTIGVTPAKQLRIVDLAVTEGTGGTTNAVFTVKLDSASTSRAITVDWDTVPNTAVDDLDFEPSSGTLTFPINTTTATISVPVVPDSIDEPDEERFFVDLSNPQGAEVFAYRGTAVILDDDAETTVSVGDAEVSEGQEGSTPATFAVTLSQAATEPVYVDVATNDLNAIAREDYEPLSQRLVFEPGETSQNVTVPVLGDTVDEGDEFFYLSLGAPQGATIRDGYGSGRILDTDLYRLTVTKAGNAAATGTVTTSPAGISCGGDCSEDYLRSTSVTLTPTVPTGYQFDGWSGACTGTGGCTVSMTQIRSVTASFSIKTYALTVTKAGAGAGNVTSTPAGIDCGADCTEQLDHGTVVSLTATPAFGSSFAGWTGACTNTTGPCVTTMTAARSATATFTLDPQTLTLTQTGTGAGTVTSTPAGITCPTDCSETYPGGTSVTLSPTPAVGSVFTGFSGACVGATCTVTMSQARAVTAEFTKIQYALTISKSGNGFVSSSPAGIDCGSDCTENYPHGTSVTLTATPAVGSSFAGWASPCPVTTGPCTLSMTAARSLTATFRPDVLVTVTRAGLGSGTVTGPNINCGTDCTETYKNGSSVTLTQVPAAGSSFVGWTGACTGTGNCVLSSMTIDKTATATYALNAQTLTVSRTGSGTGTVTSNPAGISCGATCSKSYAANTSVTLTPTPAAGSTFTGWTGACTGTGACTVVLSDSKTVGAEFSQITFPLTVARAGTGNGFITSAPNGISCGTVCAAPYATGTSVTLTPTAAAGSTFASWSGACTGSGPCTVAMTAARDVTASFTLDTQDLTVIKAGTGSGSVTSSPAGISCGADCTETYTGGTVVTLTATAALGSSFTGWSGACTGTGSCVVTMSAARSATATFTLDDQVLTVDQGGDGTGVVTSSPAGISCGDDCTETYAGGTTVTLTATPDSGSTFTGWSSPCSGTGTCVVQMTFARNVTASFGLLPQTLTVARNGTGTGSVTSSPAGISCGNDCTETYAAGTDVTLTATPASGSAFVGWSGACTGTGACVVPMDVAQNVTATFNVSAPGAGTYQESNAALVYTGSWTTSSNASDNGGAVRYASNAPASVSFTFSGTGVTWVTRKQSNGGINKVLLDGVSAGLFDRYSASTQFKVNLFTSGALADGVHTIRVEHTGTKNASATDDLAMVDAFVVTAAAVPPTTYALTVTKSGTGSGTVTSSPPGVDCGADCSESYAAGTSVSLSAVPASGSTFTGWGGACTGTGACAVTMDAAKAVGASFDVAGPGPGTYQESDAGISYVGTWTAQSNASDNGGAIKYSSSTGASATFAFQGSQVTWVSRKGPSSGIDHVFIDDVLVTDVDRYASTALYKVNVFVSALLTTGPHSIRIERSGSKNGAATASNTMLDALVVS